MLVFGQSPPLHDMSRLIEFFERSVTIFFRLKNFLMIFQKKMQVLRKKPEMTAHRKTAAGERAAAAQKLKRAA